MDLYLRTSVLLVFVLVQCEAEVRVNLTAAVGSSITFPDPVKEKGYFIFGPKTIASVSNGVFEIDESIYTNRLHWNSSTGHFTLSDLQKNDSGVYIIDSKKGNMFSKYYELKLYKPVSLPVVSRVNVSADSCTLQCSVTLTEQTTLSWFRGEQPVDSSSSAVLPLTVQLQNDTSQYKCVAQNPADKKNVIVNVTKECSLVELQSDAPRGLTNPAIIIPIVFTALIIVCCVIVVIKKKCAQKGSTRQDSVIYAQINHSKRDNANDIQSSKSSPPSGHTVNLTTVYDQINLTRLPLTPTANRKSHEGTDSILN